MTRTNPTPIANPDDRPAGTCRSSEPCATGAAHDSDLCPYHRDRARHIWVEASW